MEKLSRVKKYEELRKQIDVNATDEQVNNKVEPVLFKKMEITEEKAPRREKEYTLIKDNSDTFVNEYMDDLIRDVKKYNREKGLLHNDVTEIDILNQLKNPARLRREDYVKTIQEEPKLNEATFVKSKEEIAMQVQDLLKEENETGINISKVEIEKQDDVSKIVESIQESAVVEQADEIQLLNEQTQQIKIQVDKHAEEMEELSVGIDKTNKLLNTVLVILIIALCLVIGFTVFVVLKNSGRI